MTETAKTIAFVAAGALAVAAAYFVDYRAEPDQLEQLVGRTLNDNIDVSAPKRLRIVKFDRGTASVREFEVAEVDGVWSLPSKQDYPADATEQMASAATGVVNRKILRIAGESADTHAEYGVVDPLWGKLNAKSTGVGTRVIMTDGDDETLVDMIVGKAVKDAPGQRYVRNSKQNVVYVVEIDPTQLSTNFEDWIKDDLLELDTFALRRLFLNDYSADLSIGMTPDGRIVPQVSRQRRAEMTLARTEEASSWEVAALKKYDSKSQAMIDDAVAEGEEVNQDAVTELISGLDDLLIVDIAKKPVGLSADLKAGEDFLTNEEAFQDLASKGFIPVGGETGSEILSSEGEVIGTLNNGVEYVLRFGQLQVQTDSAASGGDEDEVEEGAAESDGGDAEDAAEATADAGAGEGEKSDGDAKAGDEAKPSDDAKEDADGENLRRYLFVTARFNEGAVQRPELKELPPLPEEKKEEATESETAPAAEDAEAASDAEASESDAAESDAGADGEAAAADAAPADAAEDGADKPATDEETDEESDAAADKPDAEAVMAQRKEIEAENQRLMDEYQSTLASGQQKVAQLNERFGDWYYVISNDVYKKIHLGRDQVIKKMAAEPATDAAGEPGDAAAGLPNLPTGIPAGEAAGADAAVGDTATPATEQP